MHPLGGDEREALGQVVPELATEHAARPGAGAVRAVRAVLHHVAEQVFIGRRDHNLSLEATTDKSVHGRDLTGASADWSRPAHSIRARDYAA
ncbi:hypothetical protein GCM10009648_05620 [Tsukamurella spumae]